MPFKQSLEVYPGLQPMLQYPVSLSQGESFRQRLLHWWMQSVPKVPSIHAKHKTLV